MSAPLDSRVLRITRWLLSQDKPRSTSDLAADVGLSERVVRYRLSSVDNYLRSFGAELTRQRGSGLSINADPDTRTAILADLGEDAVVQRVYAPEERMHLLLDLLLWSYPSTISLDQLTVDLEVSKTSARRDLKRCEPWLEQMGLPVFRRPGRGLELMGTERRVRRAIVQLLLESVPSDVIDELLHTEFENAELVRVRIPAGFRDRLASLSLHEHAQALGASDLEPLLTTGNARSVFTLYVAISEARVSDDRLINLDPGHFVSLIDHPGSDNVRALTDALQDADGPAFPDEEVAGITEYFLGLNALSAEPADGTDQEALLTQILTVASERLHESLLHDEELKRSLAMHLSRLEVRLRYGLPVHNPLLAEVVERYPDVHAVSQDLAEVVGEAMQAEVHADETGFITMYLSGAMERAHLTPRKQALVVCPSGMATAWVLVSRLQAELPELALAEVLSATGYETRDTSEFDIVVSTVPLGQDGAPVVVVSPLLSSTDLRRLNEELGRS